MTERSLGPRIGSMAGGPVRRQPLARSRSASQQPAPVRTQYACGYAKHAARRTRHAAREGEASGPRERGAETKREANTPEGR